MTELIGKFVAWYWTAWGVFWAIAIPAAMLWDTIQRTRELCQSIREKMDKEARK